MLALRLTIPTCYAFLALMSLEIGPSFCIPYVVLCAATLLETLVVVFDAKYKETPSQFAVPQRHATAAAGDESDSWAHESPANAGNKMDQH